jgi:phage terminase large subunit
MFTMPAYKGVRPGIQAVQRRLKLRGDGRPGIYLVRDALVERDQSLAEAHKPMCMEEEIEAYVWASGVVRGREADEPVKRDDHGLDSLRYSISAADGLSYDAAREEASVQVMEPYRISPI